MSFQDAKVEVPKLVTKDQMDQDRRAKLLGNNRDMSLLSLDFAKAFPVPYNTFSNNMANDEDESRSECACLPALHGRFIPLCDNKCWLLLQLYTWGRGKGMLVVV